MSQYVYPTSDIENSGVWTIEPLWSKVDEQPYSDADYVQAPQNAVNLAFTVGLGAPLDPANHTGHTLRIRAKCNVARAFKFELLQTSTVIHDSGSTNLMTSFAEYSFTLTEGEAASITDYTALRVRVTAITTYAGEYEQVSWIRLEVPSVPIDLLPDEGYQIQESDIAGNQVCAGAYALKMTVDAAGSDVYVSQLNKKLRPGCKGRVRFCVRSTVASPGIDVHWRLSDIGDNVWLNSTTGTWGAVHDNVVTGVTDAAVIEVSYDFTAHATYSIYKFSIGRGTSDYGAVYSIWVDCASLLRLLKPTPYRALIPQGGAPSVQQSVGDFYVGDVALSAGELKYGNDGRWYVNLDAYIWHLKKFWLKVGAINSAYAELGTIFWGRTTRPMVSDEAVTFQIVDAREGLFGAIPTALYDLATYPNLQEDAIGQAIPILFGERDNIMPVCIDTVLFKYKIMGYEAMEAIPAVYKAGITLTLTTDYTVNLALGEFTLVADPGDSVITCKAKGAKCKIEDGSYSALGADILYHVLTVLNSPPIPKSQIDLVSFFDLRTARTQVLAAYLTEQIAVTDFIRQLQDSNVFHLIPLLNGTFGAFRYAAGTTGAETRIDQLDMASFTLSYDTAPVRKTVVVKYGLAGSRMDPGTQNWLAASATDANIGLRYDQAEILEKETLLTSWSDAKALATFYLNLIRSPEKRVAGSVPALLLGHRPAEKLIISKAIRDGEGFDQTILAAEVYRALTLVKNAGPATVDLEAVLDLQSTGAVHNNIAHQDTHGDSHADTPHEDVAHDDSGHGDSHGNIAYEDEHLDEYTDIDYHDHPHVDTHLDTHEDAYWDNGAPEPPIPHTDHHHNTHGDSYTDTHTDVPHTDHHEDEYEDVAHTDWHNDSSHSDVEHEDEAYEDVPHVDTHEDVLHGDSEY